jgi:hypothetical protein
MRIVRYDPFETFNRLFAELDHSFRGWERDWNVSLPAITVPGVTYDDTRVYSDGETEKHFKNGALSRLDGPALIKYGKDGKIVSEEYYIDGVKKTKEEVEACRIDIEESKVHTIYLGNKKYKLTGKKLKELQATLDAS